MGIMPVCSRNGRADGTLAYPLIRRPICSNPTWLPLYHGSSDSTTAGAPTLSVSPTPGRDVLGNHACADAACLIDESVRRCGSVQGAAFDACAGAVSAKVVNSDPRAMREEEEILQSSRC
jgi:hypothetical protein